MSDFDLDAFLPYRLSVAAAQISREFSARYREKFGISIAEWRVVAHLGHSGPVSVREIHARVELEKSRVTRAAQRLETAGYLRKTPDPTDGRLVVLELTEKGKAMRADLARLARAFQADLMVRLGPDAATVMSALQSLAAPDDTLRQRAAPRDPPLP